MLTLKMKTENDAFKKDLRTEVIKCLKFVIDRIDNYDYQTNIYDTNGNNVGRFKLTWKK